MEAVMLVTLFVGSLIALGLAAITAGVDSRDLPGDDHTRSI